MYWHTLWSRRSWRLEDALSLWLNSFYFLPFEMCVSKSGFSIWYIHPQKLSQPRTVFIFPPPLEPELTRAFCFLGRVGFALRICVWPLVISEEDSGEVLCNSREETFQQPQNSLTILLEVVNLADAYLKWAASCDVPHKWKYPTGRRRQREQWEDLWYSWTPGLTPHRVLCSLSQWELPSWALCWANPSELVFWRGEVRNRAGKVLSESGAGTWDPKSACKAGSLGWP